MSIANYLLEASNFIKLSAKNKVSILVMNEDIDELINYLESPYFAKISKKQKAEARDFLANLKYI